MADDTYIHIGADGFTWQACPSGFFMNGVGARGIVLINS